LLKSKTFTIDQQVSCSYVTTNDLLYSVRASIILNNLLYFFDMYNIPSLLVSARLSMSPCNWRSWSMTGALSSWMNETSCRKFHLGILRSQRMKHPLTATTQRKTIMKNIFCPDCGKPTLQVIEKTKTILVRQAIGMMCVPFATTTNHQKEMTND
jgi:hypothetical protein